jgi:hypothetical protein
VTQETADPKEASREIIEEYVRLENVYNPVADRQVAFYGGAFPLRDIKQGEELFDNYLAMCGKSTEYWEFCVDDLKKQCEGRGIGFVTEYEAS